MVIEYFLEWVQTAPVSKRVAAAGALVRAYLVGELTTTELEDVEAALTTLTDDPAPSVRLELAECFGAFSNAPRHLMATLADDSLDISVTVLSQSPVFHDAELAGYARRGSEKQQIAVACRPWLSKELLGEMCEFVCRDAAYALLVNPAANFDAEAIHVLAERHGKDADIRNMLLAEEAICAETRLLLIEKLGSALGDFIKERNWLSSDRADQFLADVEERASIIFTANVEDTDVRSVVMGKIEDGKLTVAYLLRSLCMGNISLFAHALSELSGVRISRVESVLTGKREAAFKAVYDRAGLPAVAYGVFATALSKWKELLNSTSEINRSRLPFLVTREILSSYTKGKSEVVDGLLVLLRKLAAEAARESAKHKASEISARKAELDLVPVEKAEKMLPLEGQVEPIIDLEQFSENLQLELAQIEPEVLLGEGVHDEVSVDNGRMRIVEIATNIANSHGAGWAETRDVHFELDGMSNDEIIDGFSRAA